jgi:pimeloyl-ACP methyl ester carboxylesterase
MTINRVILALALVLIVNTLAYSFYYSIYGSKPFRIADTVNPVGFRPTQCWFEPENNWPVTECYTMNVPEDHNAPEKRMISYPVVVFRNERLFSHQSPVLHLGAGGPGAPMYLDSTESVKSIWEYHDELSLKQGRDLFVIDPRGTGLAKPRLGCDVYVDNTPARLQRNLTLKQEWDESDQDYLRCIAQLQSQGVDLGKYNSMSIADDIELMRTAANIEQWVLIGVSYGASYAQIIADKYPHSVESMILDSATFPNLKTHHHYIEQSLAPYRALYNHCNLAPDCGAPLHNIKQRIWQLHKDLNQNPIRIEMSHPYKDDVLSVALNGDRFISALISGVYQKQIFEDLPSIIVQLEAGIPKAITPYLEGYLAYILDRDYGDISASSHYCYEDKPFIDFNLIRTLALQLPEGYLKDSALLSLDQPDHCQTMQVSPAPPTMAKAIKTQIPTLFLHGELDTITRLSDVVSQREYFQYSQLYTSKSSHSVLSASECAEYVAAKFVDNNAIGHDELHCD